MFQTFLMKNRTWVLLATICVILLALYGWYLFQNKKSGATTVLNRSGAIHYKDKVYAIWLHSSPHVITKNGITLLPNKTHFSGTIPFYNCWLAEKPLADGYILTSCLYFADQVRYTLSIDPIHDEIRDYSGVVPADIVWHDINYLPRKLDWVSYIETSDGWYFTTEKNPFTLYFKNKNSASVTTITTSSEPPRVMMIYHN